eukprot:COSAG01_NODE_485_length_16397_cov_48.193827_27_plen_62_part_00
MRRRGCWRRGAAAVSRFLTWIGSPCLTRGVHGATIGAAGEWRTGVETLELGLQVRGAGRVD